MKTTTKKLNKKAHKTGNAAVDSRFIYFIPAQVFSAAPPQGPFLKKKKKKLYYKLHDFVIIHYYYLYF